MRGMKGEREINASTEKDESSGSLCRCRSKKKKNRISLRIEARIGAESDFFVSFDHQKFPILLIPFPSSFALARDMACIWTNAVWENDDWEEGGGHVSILSSAISFQVSTGKEERWRRGKRERGGVGRNEGVNSMLRNLIEYWINKANSDVGNSLNAFDPLIKMSLRNACFVLRIRIDSFALSFFFFFMKRRTIAINRNNFSL